MNTMERLPLALLLLRMSIFLVMVVWTIDKFVRPEHAAAVYENFYFIRGLGPTASFIIGAVETILLIGFVLGAQTRLTYGLVLILHGISTVSSFKQYLAPYTGPNILFFAAWPMLAGCFLLYSLREYDTLWSVSVRKGSSP